MCCADFFYKKGNIKMNNASNVSFGKPKVGGAIFVAPVGTVAPTDGTTALDPAFKNLGYVSDDGLTNSVETDIETIKAWGGDTVLEGVTSFAEKFTFDILETNQNVLTEIYGAENVTVDSRTNAIKVVQKNTNLPERVIVIETVLTGNRVKRIVIPKARITDRSMEISYKDNEPIKYPFNVAAFPNGTGEYHQEYIATAV